MALRSHRAIDQPGVTGWQCRLVERGEKHTPRAGAVKRRLAAV